MTYHSRENRNDYFPPLLSNGNISFAPDAEGTIGYTAQDYVRHGVRAFDGIVVRAERRSAVCNTLNARFFPMGKFAFIGSSPLTKWEQTLIETDGCFESTCFYADGEVIHSKGLIHPDANIYALQKKFTGTNKTKLFGFDVCLCGYNKDIDRYMDILYTRNQDGVCRIGFRMYGMDVFVGELRFFVDKEYTVTDIPNGIRLSFEALEGETVTFYYYLEDDLKQTDYCTVLEAYKEKIDACGFSGLLSECAEHFRNFYSLGYVNTSDETLNRIYQTSLYSIKCNTTEYSVAVGFNNGAWDGKYFAFDEYTSLLALLSSCQQELAKRIPTFRLHTCLKPAIQRGRDPHVTPETEEVAHFFWMVSENGKLELANNGAWLDHVFHMPLIGIGAFDYYEYSGDKTFLAECYPMIRASAKFMTKHMVYRNGDAYYVGKCTDLERLGASVENPFMTCCGIIKLLNCCAKAAAILEIDTEYATECTHVAKKLCESLPVEDGKFVPFLTCEQKSIAVFAGKFPFDVIDDNDQRLLDAWVDFETNGAAYGNMYSVGQSISPWYACWKAEGYARIKNPINAYAALRQAYSSVGVFGDMFEINEPGHIMRPWFATAAGIFVSAVNEMLLQSDGETLFIMPGIPHDIDVSFKLAAKGACTVEAEIKNGSLCKINVTQNGNDVTDRWNVIF